MNSSITDPQLQNWENFCRHHAIGDWHGTWSIYDLEGKLIRHFQCIRSFQISADGNEVNHQNHYTYSDGTTKTETFECRNKSTIRGLYLNNSFSWGSTQFNPNSIFFFETGFKHEDIRKSAVARYNTDRTLDILIICEHFKCFKNELPLVSANQSSSWKGITTKIKPDGIVSDIKETSWTQLEKLDQNYLTINFNTNISISIPRKIESNKKFFLAAEWLVNPILLYRGIRYFDTSDFSHFTLQVFNSSLKE